MRTILFSLFCLSLGSVANAASTACLVRADGESFCKGDRVEVQKQLGTIDVVAIDQDDGVSQLARIVFTAELGAAPQPLVANLKSISHLLETAGQCQAGVCVGSKALHLYNQAPKLRLGQVQIISKSGIAFVTPVDHDCCTPQALTAWNFANIAGEIRCSAAVCGGDWVSSSTGFEGRVLGLFQQTSEAPVFAFVRRGVPTDSCSPSLVFQASELSFVSH